MQNKPIIVHDEPIILPMFVMGTNSLLLIKLCLQLVFVYINLPIAHRVHCEEGPVGRNRNWFEWRIWHVGLGVVHESAEYYWKHYLHWEQFQQHILRLNNGRRQNAQSAAEFEKQVFLIILFNHTDLWRQSLNKRATHNNRVLCIIDIRKCRPGLINGFRIFFEI